MSNAAERATAVKKSNAKQIAPKNSNAKKPAAQPSAKSTAAKQGAAKKPAKKAGAAGSATKKSNAKKPAAQPSASIASREKAVHTAAVTDPHEHLRRADAKLAAVIERAGPCPLPERAKEAPDGTRSFRALVHAIVSQQLSGKAADTIYGRVEALGKGGLPAPKELLAIPDETLRATGLSGAKTRGVKDLAARVLDGSLDLDALHTHEDEAVIEMLTKVKGIGRWTAEMFLMFRLGRLDILSTADLGLRKGMMQLFGLRELPDPQTMHELAASWRPFRSVGSWYLWRVAEEAPPLRKAAPEKDGAKKAGAKKQAAPKKGARRGVPAPAKRSPAPAKKAAANKSRAEAVLARR